MQGQRASFVSECPREHPHFGRKSLAAFSPRKWCIEIIWLGGIGGQRRAAEECSVVAVTRSFGTEPRVRRPLGIFHSLDCFGVGSDGEPFCDREEGCIGIAENVLSAHAQLLSFRKSFEEIADVFV